MSLKHLNDTALIESTKQALQVSRSAEVEVLRHFKEIELRKLWVDAGSLYQYLSRTFQLTDDQVYPRLQAMRLMNAVPEVEIKLESGQLNMTTALKAHQIFKAEAKRRQVTREEKLSVLESLENISTRKAEKLLAEKYPASQTAPEKIKPVSPNKNLIQFYVDDETLAEIEKLKAKYSHQMPSGQMEDLIKILIRKANRQPEARKRAMSKVTQQNSPVDISTKHVQPKNLDQVKNSDQVEGLKDRVTPISTQAKSRSRYIAADVKREMEKTRSTGCSHLDPSGHRCGSHHFLQLDHIIEYSRGGSNDVHNLRWMCGFHNRNRSGASTNTSTNTNTNVASKNRGETGRDARSS